MLVLELVLIYILYIGMHVIYNILSLNILFNKIFFVVLVGLFVRSISQKVGDAGLLYTTEVSDIFKEHLDELVKKEKLRNVIVEQVASEALSYSSVPEGSIDLAIVIDVYHHFEYPKTAMRGKKAVL
jgi:hypothetical protein